GSANAHGEVHDFANLLRVGFRERAAEYREILCENVNQANINAPKTSDEAVTRGTLVLHPEIPAAMTNKFVQFFKCTFVEEETDTFTRGELAGLMFAFAALGPAPGFRLPIEAAKLFRAVVCPGNPGGFGGGDQAALGFRQRNLRLFARLATHLFGRRTRQ